MKNEEGLILGDIVVMKYDNTIMVIDELLEDDMVAKCVWQEEGIHKELICPIDRLQRKGIN